jgi:hypothetical protein
VWRVEKLGKKMAVEKVGWLEMERVEMMDLKLVEPMVGRMDGPVVAGLVSWLVGLWDEMKVVEKVLLLVE